MIERNFKSIDELLQHLSGVLAEAEAAEAEQAEQAEQETMDTEDDEFDWNLRRQTIMFVTNKINFETPEQFKAYVEFVYEFMLEGVEK